jgi:hypothetical protein
MESIRWHLRILADFKVFTFVLTRAIASAAGRALWDILWHQRRSQLAATTLRLIAAAVGANHFKPFCAHMWRSVDVTEITTRVTVALLVIICQVAKAAYRAWAWIFLLWLMVLVVSPFYFVGYLLSTQ